VFRTVKVKLPFEQLSVLTLAILGKVVRGVVLFMCGLGVVCGLGVGVVVLCWV